jgi:hypothetical protein
MTELNRSDIAMRFAWLTDLVLLGTHAIVGGINCPAGRQKWEMPIPGCAVIRKGA